MVLKLEDDSFFDAHPPLKRARNCRKSRIHFHLRIIRQAAPTLASTAGAVSRIDFTSYFEGVRGLRIQLDAAITPGAAGGPALLGDTMIGLSFAPATKAENISYVIPCEEIELFLKGLRAGSYHGRPNLDVVLQEFDIPLCVPSWGWISQFMVSWSSNWASSLATPPFASGISSPKSATRILMTRGWSIWKTALMLPSLTCSVKRRSMGRRRWRWSDPGNLSTWTSPSNPIRPASCRPLNGVYPDYFVCGPMVFSDASQDLLLDLVNSTIAGSTGLSSTLRLLSQENPLVTRCDDMPKFEGERLVVVTSFFQHKVAENYASPVTQVVKAINGVPIKNLAHLVQVLRDSKEKFISIDFFGRYSDTLVFPREEMLADTETILADNNVHSQGSPAMLAIWNVRK